MNAIAGVFHLSGRPDARIRALVGLRASADSAPAIQVWDGGRIAMAARPDVQRSPYASAGCFTSGGYAVAADARLDNRSELIRLLEMDPSACNPAIVLRAYLRWGVDCVDHLIGDFAFAIWDPRSQTMFCGRDPMGVQPLYYHGSAAQFAFATDLKGLLALDDVASGVDDERIASYVLGVELDRQKTFYRGIARLPAAHVMSVDAAGVSIRRYWTPGAAARIQPMTDDDYADAFREIFSNAVHARMDGGSLTAAALSGGLDSSSIVCTARSLSKSGAAGLHTFSLVFPDMSPAELQRIDERRFISSVTRTGGITPHHVRGDQISPLQDVHRIVSVLDEPYDTPNLYLHWAMYGAAANVGATVFMDGFDGDSAVSHGLGRLNTMLAAGEWTLFEQETRAFAEKRGIGPGAVLRYYGLPHLDELARHGRWREWFRGARQLHRRFGVSRRDLALMHGLAASPLGRSRRRQRASSAAELLLHRPPDGNGQPTDGALGGRDAHVDGLSLPLYQRTLEIAHRCAASFGVEARYPFFDRRLIDFCVALPEDQKFSGGRTRLVLRRAMEGILPKEIQWRADKGNLGPAFHRGLRRADAELIRTVDLEPLRGRVDIALLDRMRNEYCQSGGNGQQAGDTDPLLLFRMTTLAVWLQEQSAAPAPEAVPARLHRETASPADWAVAQQVTGVA